jgi:hypothetical protein
MTGQIIPFRSQAFEYAEYYKYVVSSAIYSSDDPALDSWSIKHLGPRFTLSPQFLPGSDDINKSWFVFFT